MPAACSSDVIRAGAIDELLSGSSGLDEPCFVPGLCAAPEVLLADVVQALRRLREDPSGGTRLRVFVARGHRHDLPSRLLARPRLEGPGELQAWIEAGASTADACLTFNGIGAYDEALARRVCRGLLGPILRARGVTACGADLYAFMGGYGDTPFGVHSDPDHSTLLHLGPGDKELYLWSPARYRELTGGEESSFAVDELLSHGERYVLRPGDLLHIPAGVFHIARAAAFSVTLGLTIFPSLCQDLLRRSAELYLRALPRTDLGFFSFPSAAEGSEVEAALGTALGNGEALQWDLGRAARRYLALLRSNGYLVPPPIAISPAERPSPPLADDQLLRTPEEYWLGAEQVEDHCELLVRGRVLRMRPHARLPELLARLNDGLRVGEAAAMLGDRFLPEATRHLLQVLLDLGGIEPVDDARPLAAAV
jgi:hypothetical protein